VSARTFLVFMAVLAVIGLLGYGVLKKNAEAIELGTAYPDATLSQLDGPGSRSVADYSGEWVLVNVWASWCTPCRTEAPILERFYRAQRKHDFTVLGVDTQDNEPDGRSFVNEFGLTYPQLHDSGREQYDRLGMTGVPESFLVDPQGDIAAVRRGPVTEDYLRSNVEPLVRGRIEG
jgi:cytochrome c biogenesis protein CcmG, thiol:disulfide interchange protein DsbE